MTEPDLEARVAALEARIETVAADAAAARHLAAAQDRDVADLGVKVDANRKAINALGEQTASGFAEVRIRFDEVDRRIDDVVDQMTTGFVDVRARLDQTAAGQEQIVGLLNTLIDSQPEDE